MLISPPISATLHRGNDLPHSNLDSKQKNSNLLNAVSSQSPNLIYQRNLPVSLAPETLAARKLVAECSAYVSEAVPGFHPSQADLTYDSKLLEQNNVKSENLEYDFLENTTMLEPATPTPSPTSTSPLQSTPSSPLSRDAPLLGWNSARDSRGLSATRTVLLEGGSSSSHSTRPASPSWISLSTCTPRTESAITWADEDPGVLLEQRALRKPLGKTLVVYNSMSGDALQQQSKIARRMAAMHRKKHRTAQRQESAMFVDPATGQTVYSDMIGLDIRPIPPKARPKVWQSIVLCSSIINLLRFPINALKIISMK